MGGGRREKVRGVYRFSSLVKQNKKAKICFVIHIAGEKKLLFCIYAVIVKQKKKALLITTHVHMDTGITSWGPGGGTPEPPHPRLGVAPAGDRAAYLASRRPRPSPALASARPPAS